MTERTPNDLDTIMYTLGLLAGTVWPHGIPRGVRITLLSAPRRGFDMMLTHPDFIAQGFEPWIVRLVGKLPDWFVFPDASVGGLTEEHHRQFWIGFDDGDMPMSTKRCTKRLNVLRSEIPLGGFGRELTRAELAEIQQAGHLISAGARVIRAATDTPSLGSVWTCTHERTLSNTDITVGMIQCHKQAAHVRSTVEGDGLYE